VLLDHQRRLVKMAKAKVTPEAVVWGRKGQLLYRGRIYDLYAELGKKRSAPTHHDLREALDAITSGRKVLQKETEPIGCLIQSENGSGAN
jgi:hypothetical protein